MADHGRRRAAVPRQAAPAKADPQLQAVPEDRGGLDVRRRGQGGGHRRGDCDPDVEGPAHELVDDQRPGLDGLVRRLGERRLAPSRGTSSSRAS